MTVREGAGVSAAETPAETPPQKLTEQFILGVPWSENDIADYMAQLKDEYAGCEIEAVRHVVRTSERIGGKSSALLTVVGVFSISSFWFDDPTRYYWFDQAPLVAAWAFAFLFASAILLTLNVLVVGWRGEHDKVKRSSYFKATMNVVKWRALKFTVALCLALVGIVLLTSLTVAQMFFQAEW